MHRRARSSAAQGFGGLLALVLVALFTVVPAAGRSASAQEDPEPVEPTPVTVSDFYPETANLSDCVGLVEKPGCGSKARGGWRQFVVFAALLVGLGVIVWRVLAGVRANRSRESDSGDDVTGPPSPTRSSSNEPPTPPPTSPSPPSTPPSGRTTP